MSKKTISIIVPVFNEQDNLNELCQRLTAVLQQLSYSVEILLIDDGSHDESWSEILRLSKKDPQLKGLKLSRNFGHQAALSAGLDHVSSDAVIMMDADLQHPPELIPQLIEKWEEGIDVVYTVRTKAEDYPILKKWSSAFFYWLWNRFSGVHIPPGSADFRLLSRQALQSLKTMQERTRFLRGMVSWIGFKTAEVTYQASSRFSGQTKYSFGRMLRFSLSGITSFSSVPLYCATVVGVVISLLSFIYGLYAVYMKFFTDVVVPGWTSILVSVLFLGGIQLLAIGVLGEYLAKIYEEVKQRPMYIVEKTEGKLALAQKD